MKSVQCVEIFNCKATTLLGEENPVTTEKDLEVHNLGESASDLKDSVKEDAHDANDDKKYYQQNLLLIKRSNRLLMIQWSSQPRISLIHWRKMNK